MKQTLCLRYNSDFPCCRTAPGIMEMALPAKPFDAILKECFSITIVFISFLCDILYPDKAQYINLKKLKQEPTEHSTDTFRRVLNDLIWKIHWKNRKFKYSYIMLEFQTRNDLDMPLRIMDYNAQLTRFCVIDNALFGKHQYPYVLPIVLHIGNDRWTARSNIGDMLSPVPEQMSLEQPPYHAYSLVDVREKKLTINGHESDIVRTDSLAFQILALAGCQSLDALEEAAPRMLAAVRDIPQPEKRSDLSAFLAEAVRSLLYSFGLKDAPLCKNLEEAVSELAQNAQVWRKRLG